MSAGEAFLRATRLTGDRRLLRSLVLLALLSAGAFDQSVRVQGAFERAVVVAERDSIEFRSDSVSL
jgi:hypothetical protein